MAKLVVRGKQGGREIRVDKRKERGDGPSRVVKRNERESGETHISERTTRNNLPLDRNSERKKKDKLPGIRNRRSSGENILN